MTTRHIVFFTTLMLTLALLGCSAQNQQPPQVANENLFGILPGSPWEIEQSEIIRFPGNPTFFSVVAASGKNYESGGQSNILCLLRYSDDKKSWLAIWKSHIFEGASPWEELIITAPDRQILCAGSYYVGASSAMESHVISIDSKEKVKVLADSYLGRGGDIVLEQDNTIVLTESDVGLTKFSVINGKIVKKKFKRDEMAPKDSVAAPFIFQGKTIVPTDKSVIRIKVGETVSFIPADEPTKKAFNETGTVEIYTDAMGGPLTVSEVSRLWQNYYTFSSIGTFNFYLANNQIEAVEEPQPTFSVIVEQ